jgi:hypothetical protein
MFRFRPAKGNYEGKVPKKMNSQFTLTWGDHSSRCGTKEKVLNSPLQTEPVHTNTRWTILKMSMLDQMKTTSTPNLFLTGRTSNKTKMKLNGVKWPHLINDFLSPKKKINLSMVWWGHPLTYEVFPNPENWSSCTDDRQVRSLFW